MIQKPPPKNAAILLTLLIDSFNIQVLLNSYMHGDVLALASTLVFNILWFLYSVSVTFPLGKVSFLHFLNKNF